MTLFITEKEMIERFADGLKEAASRCRQFHTVPESERPDLFVKLIASLRISAGSAHQLAMARIDQPQWLLYRDTLEKFSDFAKDTIFVDSEGSIWETVAIELDRLAETGRKTAQSAGWSREAVLDEMDRRETEAKLNVN